MERRMTKKDYIIILIMTVVYALMAFINLGSLSAPVSSYTPEDTRLSIMVFFEEETEISRVTYYVGIGNDWYSAGQLDAEYVDEDNRFAELCKLEKPSNNVFKWYHRDVQAKASAVRLTTRKYYDPDSNISGIEGEFYEVAFWTEGEDGLELIKIARTEVLNDESEGMIRLFDEQDIAVSEPSYYNSTYFDEVYFPRTAYEYMEDMNIYENTHPPLGKILIMWSMRIFGVNPFGWRFMGTFFGMLMIPLMYVFGKRIFGN
ncbi:MAG: phospholipid carrier-dependent glycosyltransferase, partial [Clostridia bacterium]|nr:phospholipid carrier-dependent glycosyltransferase [Clostridia bacterium]